MQLLERVLKDTRSLVAGLLDGAMLPCQMAPSWELTIVGLKKEPNHTCQHPTEGDREHLWSASKFRLLCCGHGDMLGEMV